MTSSDEKRRVRRMLAWLVTGAFWIAFAVHASSYPLNHDVGWFLYMARGMLGGDLLEIPFIEVNLPVMAYLAMVPAMIANVSGLSPVIVAKVSVLILCIGSAAGSVALLRPLPEGRTSLLRPLVALALAPVLLGIIGMDFGQREHLMFAFVLPYLVVCGRRLRGMTVGTWASIATGLAAGVGFALKPYFVLPLVAVEALVWWDAGSIRAWARRPELRTIVAALVAIAVAIVAAHPAQVELLWDAQHLYAQFASRSRWTLVLNPLSLLPLMAAFAFVALGAEDGFLRTFARVLLVFAAAAWIGAIGQGKGWSYHYYPATAAAMIVTIGLVGAWIGRTVRSVRPPGAVALASAVLVCATFYCVGTWLLRDHVNVARARVERIMAQRAWIERENIRSLAILSPAVPAGFPLINYAEVEWASPFSSLWWIEAAHGGVATAGGQRVAAPIATDPIEQAFLRAFVGQFASIRPDAILVDTARDSRFDGESFPYVAYLSQDARFRDLWQQYQAEGELGRYTVYRRRPIDQ